MEEETHHDPSSRIPSDAAPKRRKGNARRFKRAALTVTVLFGISCCWYYFSHTYEVLSIIDGDTFVIKSWGGQMQVQLAGADAPELHKGERYALEAQQYLTSRILHRKVWLQILDLGYRLDYKDRLLCWVWIDGENISYTLVTHGLAKFSGMAQGDQRKELVALQNEAKQHGLGLWSTIKTVSFKPENGDETEEEEALDQD